jgi:hypothetical protein
MPKLPIYPVLNGEVEESAFSANHFIVNWIVPRAYTSTLATRSKFFII